ncbi:retrovirus-related pol polyprotein from transposon TNT 1-94 [Tanacetum coccineum]
MIQNLSMIMNIMTLGYMKSPLPKIGGNELVNEETTVHDNQTVRDDDTLSSPQSLNVEEQIQEENLGRGHPHYVNCDKFSSCHRTFLETIEKEREPVTYYKAIKDKRWRSAMDSELEALEQNKTWTIEKLPPNKKALGCNETFASVAKMVNVRVFLAIVAAKQRELHQMDVHNAFLHGDLEEEVFMKLPPGLHKGQPGEASKLHYSLFTLQQNGVQLNVLVYVDDLIVSGNDHEDITQFKTYLSCPLTRRSLTGWLVYLSDSPISWKTKKQHIVSRSSAKAEYRSMALTTGELKWLKGLLKSFGIHHPQPMLLYCASQAALPISRNPVFHERTKHIEVDCHYIHDELVSGNLDARHVHTKEQVADFFTKDLGKV